MSTLPPGFSTEVPTSTTLIGNRWLTTEKGGHTTIVPVVGGTILWNLPELPHVHPSRSTSASHVPQLEVKMCASGEEGS